MMHDRFVKRFEVKNSFDGITDNRQARNQISLSDCLMSGLTIFSLKYPSLLQFEQDKMAKIKTIVSKMMALPDMISKSGGQP